MKDYWLSKEDFKKIDDILGRHGFGGYYDLIECLKGVISKFGKGKLKKGWEQEITCLPEAVTLLMAMK